MAQNSKIIKHASTSTPSPHHQNHHITHHNINQPIPSIIKNKETNPSHPSTYINQTSKKHQHPIQNTTTITQHPHLTHQSHTHTPQINHQKHQNQKQKSAFKSINHTSHTTITHTQQHRNNPTIQQTKQSQSATNQHHSPHQTHTSKHQIQSQFKIIQTQRNTHNQYNQHITQQKIKNTKKINTKKLHMSNIHKSSQTSSQKKKIPPNIQKSTQIIKSIILNLNQTHHTHHKSIIRSST